ncbi:MAG: Lrp/AsnC family transcriptional regulator [Nanoarchaeota archaeon]
MKKIKQTAIDPVELKVLNLLLKNSRQSIRMLARKAGLSAATVMKRLHRLEHAGVIQGYTAQLDYEALGYDIPVLIDLQVSKGKLFQVERKIATHPNVIAVYDTTGGFDATIIAIFKTRRAMDAFLKLIQSYDFVERTETRVILNVIKDARLTVD